jgi:hypothetical protein
VGKVLMSPEVEYTSLPNKIEGVASASA